MTDPSAPPDQPGQPEEELDDERIFRIVVKGLTVPGQPDRSLAEAVDHQLDTMVKALGERWIGGPWNPNEDIPEHTTGYLNSKQDNLREELEGVLRDWTCHTDPEWQISMLLYLWWRSFRLMERSLPLFS